MQTPDTALVLIQHALTPVFLIVGIGTLLNSLTARLSRIVDRVRWFDSPEAEHFQTQRDEEFKALSRRMRWANAAVNFLTGAAVIVCVNIFFIVLKGYFLIPLDPYIIGSFVLSLVALSCGMLCFFVEVSIATASLKVSKRYIK